MEDQRQNNLKKLRCEFKRPRVAKEDIARLAGISYQTYWKAEADRPIRQSTAISIYGAVNATREYQGLPPVLIEDLGLNY